MTRDKRDRIDFKLDYNMTGLDFEAYCANLLKCIGYTNVVSTPKKQRHGVDILAEKNGVKYAFQCKNQTRQLGVSDVTEVIYGKLHYKCDRAAVITNNMFSQKAIELADGTGVELWDRLDLQGLEQIIKMRNK